MERVYVGNLPPDIRIKDIDDFFRPFGKLVAIDVNNRGNPAFAFVQFDSTRNALSAVRNRHGYDYEGYTLQVKLVENNVGTGNFEVRNQRRQITPPPPPPLFNNDFNNQMGGGFGNNNNATNFGRGNSGGGNSNFGGGNRNFGPNNSNFGPNNSNFGPNNSNFGANNSNFGSNNSGNFGNDSFSSSSSFQRNTSSQNMIQYPNTNVRSIMPAQNNMIEYPNNNVWDNGSGANSNRNSNRGGGGGNFSNMGNDFNNMGGGGGDYVYNPNNNCYADNDFEDRFTQGLSGSGRKWFNRYIRKGFPPKIAREKALEHRTLPYLREGGRNQTPNNAVPNLPLPALENFGNKIMSLFSGNNAGGNFGGGANANQMMPNFNNWGNNNNMQRGGGFSNDFNMAGPSSSNNRSGNRNEIRSLVPMRGGAAVNRGGRPDAGRRAEPGILDKMLAEMDDDQSELVLTNEVHQDQTTVAKGTQGPTGTVVFKDVAPNDQFNFNISLDKKDHHAKYEAQMPLKLTEEITSEPDELKLYKAEQKRMKKYLKQGIDLEVAKLLCKKYVHDLRKELLRSKKETKDKISDCKEDLMTDMEVTKVPEINKVEITFCNTPVPETNEVEKIFCNTPLDKKHPEYDLSLNSCNELVIENEVTSSMPIDMIPCKEEKYTTSQNELSLDNDVKPVVTDKIKLTGAARKRLKYYIDEGMPPEEARKLCQKPMREVREDLKVYKKDGMFKRKKTNSDNSKATDKKLTNENSVNNLKKYDNSKATDKKLTDENLVKKVGKVDKIGVVNTPIATQHNVNSCSKETKEIIIKIAVIPPDYPKTLWPDDKLQAIKDAILHKIVEQRKGSIKPKFSYCSLKPGYAVFSCRDNETSEWMLKTVPTLKPWPKAVLKVVTDIPKPTIVIGYFPEDENTSNESIIGQIESQNSDLSIDYWKVLKRVIKGSCIELTLLIDPISAEVLKRNDFSIYYKYGKVNVRSIKKRQQTKAAERSVSL